MIGVGLTDEEKRVRIAEACGWSRCGPYRLGRSGNQRVVLKGVHPQYSTQSELPDYLSSLDASFAFVAAMRTKGWRITITQPDRWLVSAANEDGEGYELSHNDSLAVAICDTLLMALASLPVHQPQPDNV